MNKFKKRVAIEAERIVDENYNDLTITPKYKITVREVDGTISEHFINAEDMQSALRLLKLGKNRGVGSIVFVVLMIIAIVSAALTVA